MNEPRLLLFDSDVFVLLAGCGLLPAFFAATGVEPHLARRLQPLPYMLERGKLARKYSGRIRERALAWCHKVPPLELTPSPEVLDRFLGIANVDPGEALLLALAAETSASLVASGDKRACIEIGRSRALDRERAMLQGKVICLEVALKLLGEQLTFSEFVSKLGNVRDTNRTLRILLPRGEATTQEEFSAGLSSYLRDLIAQTGGLLYRAKGPSN